MFWIISNHLHFRTQDEKRRTVFKSNCLVLKLSHPALISLSIFIYILSPSLPSSILNLSVYLSRFPLSTFCLFLIYSSLFLIYSSLFLIYSSLFLITPLNDYLLIYQYFLLIIWPEFWNLLYIYIYLSISCYRNT